MKKILCLVVMLCAITLAAFSQGFSNQGFSNQGFAIIQEFIGDVELKPAGAAAFVPARAGVEIASDTIVSTGFKSTAVIMVGSAVIAVRPLTRLSLAEIQAASGAENVSMNLHAGRVKVDVKPPAGTRASFTVQGPTATASVRGTSFEFDTRNLNVIEGTVSFMGSSGLAVPVSAGGESFVGSEGGVADPVEIADALYQPAPPIGVEPLSGSGTLTSASNGEFSVKIEY